MKPKQRLLTSLGDAVGAPPGSDDFTILKSIAAALNLSVDEQDGSLVQQSSKQKKRSRQQTSTSSDEEEEASESMPSDNDSDSKGGGDEPPELETLFVNPLKIEDPRSADQAPNFDSIHSPAAEGPMIEGAELFEWLISPVDLETFHDCFEQQPLLITRKHNRKYYQGIFGTADIEKLLQKGLHYSTEVDVTYYNGKNRATINTNDPSGRVELGSEGITADAGIVWRRFKKDGCSVRLLHPQRYCDPLYRLLAGLEVYWQSNVGCNCYLTPAGNQGFAPHFDDIDAIVLQIEGKKRWRLYVPAAPEHILPRYSSRDFDQSELGECIMEVVLKPGDLLYMPRGMVHQAESLPDTHSLHLTLSCNQQRSWAVFFENVLPKAVATAAKQHIELRRTVPRDAGDYMGLMHSGVDADNSSGEDDDDDMENHVQAGAHRRAVFKEMATVCMEAIAEHLPLDWGVDAFASDFMTRRLPPVLPQTNVHTDIDDLNEASGSQKPSPQKQMSRLIRSGARVRVVHPGIARLVVDKEGDEQAAVVVHCLSNTRAQHASLNTEQGEGVNDSGIPAEIEFSIGCLPTLAALLDAEDEDGVLVDELPEPEDDEMSALQIAQSLGCAGILVVV